MNTYWIHLSGKSFMVRAQLTFVTTVNIEFRTYSDQFNYEVVGYAPHDALIIMEQETNIQNIENHDSATSVSSTTPSAVDH